MFAMIFLMVFFCDSGVLLYNTITRWWQLKYFLFSTLFGEESHFDEHIFQMGWFNHHLDHRIKKYPPLQAPL